MNLSLPLFCSFIQSITASFLSDVLYVGTTFTDHGDYRHDVPAISSRSVIQLLTPPYSLLAFAGTSTISILPSFPFPNRVS